MNTRTMRRKAQKDEADGDGLALFCKVKECCAEIDRLRRLLCRVADDWLAWGPTDDGTVEGKRLEGTLTAVVRLARAVRPRRKK